MGLPGDRALRLNDLRRALNQALDDAAERFGPEVSLEQAGNYWNLPFDTAYAFDDDAGLRVDVGDTVIDDVPAMQALLARPDAEAGFDAHDLAALAQLLRWLAFQDAPRGPAMRREGVTDDQVLRLLRQQWSSTWADADSRKLASVRRSVVSAIAHADEPAAVALFDQAEQVVLELDVRARPARWRSLTYCLIDAVWGFDQEEAKSNRELVGRVATELDPTEDPCLSGSALPEDPLPLRAFLNVFNVDQLAAVTDGQRTGQHRGLLRAEVALRYARTLVQHGVHNLPDARDLLSLDGRRRQHLDDTLRTVPGDPRGLQRGYLWQLIGDGDLVMSDLLVHQELTRRGVVVQPNEVPALLRVIAYRLSEQGRPTTAWKLHHALWKAARLARWTVPASVDTVFESRPIRRE